MQNEESKPATVMTADMKHDIARTPAPRAGDGEVTAAQAKDAAGATPTSRRARAKTGGNLQAMRRRAGEKARAAGTVGSGGDASAAEPSPVHCGAQREAASDGQAMRAEDIQAMLVAARKEAWAAARARRGTRPAERGARPSEAAVAASNRAFRQRAAQRLQEAWRGRRVRAKAARFREVWSCTMRRAAQLGREVLLQWRKASIAAIERRAAKQQGKAARKARRLAATRMQAEWRGAMGRREAVRRQQQRLASVHAEIEANLQMLRDAYDARAREEAERRAACEETRRVVAEGEARRAAAAFVRRLTARRARAATARERMAKRAIAQAAAALAADAEARRRSACVRVQAAARRRAAVQVAAAQRVAAAAQAAEARRAADRRVAEEVPGWLQEAEARLWLGREQHEVAAWWAEAAAWMARVETRLLSTRSPLTELPWPRGSGGRQRRMARIRRRGSCWAIDCETAELRAEARAEQRFLRAAAARSIIVSK